MKHSKRMAYPYIFVIVLAICMLWQNAAYVRAEGNDEKDTILIQQGGTETEYIAEPIKIQYGGNTIESKLTPVKVNDIWMVPVKYVFSDILNFSYRYSEDDKSIIIKTPGRDSKIQFTVDSNTALVNGISQTMPIEVLVGTRQSNNVTDYMIPLEFTLKSLGYTYFIQDIQSSDNMIRYVIQINSHYIFHREEDDITFDSAKYNNALTGISIKENQEGTQNYIQGITLQPISSEDISISQTAKDYSVTISFQKTYNPFGEFTEIINNDIVQKIRVWETEDTVTNICIYYQKKYIYTQKVTEQGAMITLSKGSFSMKVILPKEVEFSQITTTDQYWNKKFLILIPGNYVSFYKENPPFSNTTNIKGITVKKTAEGNTKIIVTTNSLKGYKLTEGTDSFTVKIGSPQNIYDNIVLLDAGHGGKDGGAAKGGLKEKKLCLSILYTYAKQYFESMTSTVKAYWTRHNDTFINLYTRPTLSAKYHADLFVSLHMNSASSAAANGTEVYYSKLNNEKNSSGLSSKMFASRMHNTLVDTLNNKSRGVKQAGFVVTKNNTVPAILIELGFITGNSDAKKLKKTSYQKKAAQAIYQGIEDTFKKYPAER